MLRYAEVAHSRHTAGHPSDRDIMEFWAALHTHAREAKNELIASQDIEAWARHYHMYSNGTVPAWLLKTAAKERDAFSGPHSANLITVCVGSPEWSPIRLRPALVHGNSTANWDGPRAWGWYFPRWDRRQAVKKAIMAELDRQVEAELDRIERKNPPGAPRPARSQHMEWFVRYQFNGAHIEDLRKEKGPRTPASTVYKALENTARHLEVTLATKPPGRPSKSPKL